MTVVPDASHFNTPRSPSDLFWSFTGLALQGFGGVLVIVQRVVVDQKRWLSQTDFIEVWAVAQVLPGPNIVNLAMIIGNRYFGWRGSLASVGGVLLIPMLVVLSLAAVYGQFAHVPAVAGALRGMAAVSAGMVMGTGLRLAFSLGGNVLGKVLCTLISAATFGMVALLHWPQIWVLLGLGLTSCTVAWFKLRAQDAVKLGTRPNHE
jgi:chromate transporter